MKIIILISVLILSNYLSYGQDNQGFQIGELRLPTSKDTTAVKSQYIIRSIYADDNSDKSKVIGKVTDLESGQILWGVNVLFNFNKLYATTDSTGKYSIENISPRKYKIRVTYIGYKSIETQLEIKGNEVIVIDFQLAVETIASTDFYQIPIVNPFTSDASIEYKLSIPSHVSIKIYDMIGNVCRTLVEERQNKGEYNITWDHKDDNGNIVNDGNYKVLLEVDGTRLRSKNVFVKHKAK